MIQEWRGGSKIETHQNPIFPRQSLKRYTFCVESTDSIFFLLGLTPIVN